MQLDAPGSGATRVDLPRGFRDCSAATRASTFKDSTRNYSLQPCEPEVAISEQSQSRVTTRSALRCRLAIVTIRFSTSLAPDGDLATSGASITRSASMTPISELAEFVRDTGANARQARLFRAWSGGSHSYDAERDSIRVRLVSPAGHQHALGILVVCGGANTNTHAPGKRLRSVASSSVPAPSGARGSRIALRTPMLWSEISKQGTR